jgi:acyl-CoA synthetase (AMP-forming)/AMP-acid ligase II
MNLFAAVHAAVLGARLAGLEQATHAHLTPLGLLRLLGDDGQRRRLDGVHVLVAGDRLSPALHDRAAEAGARVSHYYGAAELSFVAWGGHGADLRPFPGVEVAARDGALWVRSAFVCAGYLGAPGPLARDAGGWATVGDRGGVSGGVVTVHGRGDEAVTTGGATVWVADVEQSLREAASGEVVVLGVPHTQLGQVLAAVLTEAADLAPARRASRAGLAPSHRPRLWFRVPRLPMTEAGKVDRAALRRAAVDGAGVARLV